MADPLNAFVPGQTVYIAGATTGPLAGLRFASKDIFDVAGTVTGGGNPDWAATHAPATATAPVVSTLLEAGATLIGKTITDELTRGILGINAHYGTPLNPAAPDRVPGGSSSGSAAAVAGGLADFALGSDTGGSVRVPSSFCGLYGIRPTHGKIPLQGIIEQAPSYDTIGWFARDAEILARVGGVLFGGEPDAEAPARLVIAADAYEVADDAVRAAHEPALDAMRALAGECESLRLCPASLADWQRAMSKRQTWEANRSFADWVDATNPRFAYDVAQRFFSGDAMTEDEMMAAEPVRQGHRDWMAEVLMPGTVIALPTAPGPAPLKGLAQSEMWDMRDRITRLTCIAGGAGLPQVSLPLCRVDGLPVGISLIGPKNSDTNLLALAQQVAERM
ncbi:MAG: amidase [Alphaproteobacteria bacterium]|nr:amidase [Alphaproteobacteria bacterium]